MTGARPPRHALRTLLAAAVATSAAAGPASAAQVSTDQRCYADPTVRKDSVQVSGSAFPVSGTFDATLDGSPLAALTGMTDAAGMLSGSFPTPKLPPGRTQKSFTLAVSSGGQEARTVFAVSKLSASYAPQTGSLRSRVRFAVRGFALSGKAQPTVYLHYVSPKGTLRSTVPLGKTSGSCGRLRSARRPLFAFAPSRGTWRLQFDTSRAYRKGSPAGSFLYFVVSLDVG